MATFSHETYLSPFTWRYGSEEMRRIWSEEYRRHLWRRVWVALARAQAKAGLVTTEEVADLEAHIDDIDLDAALALEGEIGHDVMAEIRVFASQCPIGGRILHLGATSADITDNADVLRMRDALDVLLSKLRELIKLFANQVEAWADYPCMGFTHLQPAEPITVGYRLAVTLQDLIEDYHILTERRRRLRGKGFRGAVGSRASYVHLLSGTAITPAELERLALRELGLEAYAITTQVYPRKQDWQIVSALAGLGQTLYRFAFDVRLLQSPTFGEWHEPFREKQVGSSAMPFKRNPVNAENMDSLARLLAHLPAVLWDNAAHMLLERTLDDSANRRVVLAEAFLAADELLRRATRIVRGLSFNTARISQNLTTYGVFAATERVLMEVVRRGGDRQKAHEVIRRHSMAAWEAIQRGQANPLVDSLSEDAYLNRWLSADEIRSLLRVEEHIGDVTQRAMEMARVARTTILETFDKE